MFVFKRTSDGGYRITEYVGDRNTTQLIFLEDIGGVAVTSLGEWAFEGLNKLIFVKIGGNIKAVEEKAFATCYNLKKVEIDSSVIFLGDAVFMWCENLKFARIGDNINTLGVKLFASCPNLEAVEIGKGVEVIDAMAFYNCSSLLGGDMPNGITTIGKQAFALCVKMDSVTLGENIKSIDKAAFKGCRNLKVFEIKTVKPPMGGEGMFSGVDRDFKIVVPKESLEQYKNAPIWSKYAKKIVAK